MRNPFRLPRAGARALLPALLSCALTVGAAEQTALTNELADMSIEELMHVEVTLASRRSRPLSDTAAAVFVVTREDIQRSGVTTIPDALRMVPGLQVARIDANKWAVTARGFNGELANKLLVLVDGRAMYDPVFAGVVWNTLDLLLDDIDRIEVIRGPGGALWGANAVNGIINIVTRSAAETQGERARIGGGNEETAFGSGRHGGRLGDAFFYRVWAKYFERDGSVDLDGMDAADDWDALRGGFRIDGAVTEDDALTIHGDLYDLTSHSSVRTVTATGAGARDVTAVAQGGYVLSRWEHTESDERKTTLQTYYSRYEAGEGSILAPQHRDTLDVDLEHRFAAAGRHEWVAGAGYRWTAEALRSDVVRFDPQVRHDELGSVFLQDDVWLVYDRLRASLGARLEDNDYTGLEAQPNARLIWLASERQSVWAGVSRAVRTPSRAEDDVSFATDVLPEGALYPGSPTAETEIRGSDMSDSETVIAYEFGYRNALTERLSIDTTAFYDHYDDLRTFETLPPEPAPDGSLAPLVVPLVADNNMGGATYGFEASGDCRVTERWRLAPAYTLLFLDLSADPGSTDTSARRVEDDAPRGQASLRSLWNVSRRVQLDAWLRHVDAIHSRSVPAYSAVDARVSWRLDADTTVELVGQNLLDAAHVEFTGDYVRGATRQVERSVFARLTRKF